MWSQIVLICVSLVPELNRDRQGAETTYFITSVYGAWLPGEVGAVPRTRNQFGAPLPESNLYTERQSRIRMAQNPYLPDSLRRQVVLKSLREVCFYRGRTLLADHVRTNHIHIVITADPKPEQVLNAMKAYGSRALNELELDGPDRRPWARHGSTRYLWCEDSVRKAIQYVIPEQGEPMSVFEGPAPG